MVNEEYMSDEFRDELIDALRDQLGDEYEISYTTAEKVNGTKEGITIRQEGSNVAPTLYPGNFISQNLDADAKELAEAIADKYREASENIPNFNLDLSRENAQERLYPEVISAERNEGILQHSPHRMITDDLAVIARYRVGEDGSFIVKDSHLDTLGMSDEEVLDTAIKNIDHHEYSARDIKDVMADMMGADAKMLGMFPDTRPEFYVLTNDEKIHGAAALASDVVLQNAAGDINRDYPNSYGFYVLPSSLHEVLLIPDEKVRSKEEEEQLEIMVQSVNETQVAPEDVLSDRVYHYDGLSHELSMVDPNAETKEEADELEESYSLSH